MKNRWRLAKKRKRKIPVINLETETREVKAEVRSFKVDLAKSYQPPTDKEVLEGLEFQDNYEAAFLIKNLKKENAVLKGKLTKLTKKYEACEADRKMYIQQLNYLHGHEESE